MKLRFKLRTLLIATALLCVFLGLQVHVHNKAKRFVEEMKESPLAKQGPPDGYRSFASAEDYELYASVSPVSLSDVFLFRRRCHVFVGAFKAKDNTLNNAYELYWIKCFGEVETQDELISIPKESN